MKNNLIASTIYKTISATISVIGFILMTNILNKDFNTGIFVYFTNISNIFCYILIIIILIDCIKKISKGETRGYSTKLRRTKGIATFGILLTGFIYHFLLADLSDPTFFHLDNMITHYIIPIMFIVDWILFDQKGTYKVYEPLIWLIFPYTYMIYALIRGAIVGSDALIQYPYGFLDVSEIGYGGVAIWVLVLSVIFISVGYLMWLYDQSYIENKKIKFRFKK